MSHVLHMIKLAVGCSTLDDLRESGQTQRVHGHTFIRTRTKPKQAPDILNGGSIYRVMNGLILCRQPVIGFKSYTRDDGHSGTLILVSDDIIRVQPRPMRPFQGWRYLKDADAPLDISARTHDDDGITSLPQHLRTRLTNLGLL